MDEREKRLKEFEAKGIVHTDAQGIRVVDASRLQGPVSFLSQENDERRKVGKKRNKKKPKSSSPPTPEEEEEVPEGAGPKVLLPSEMKKRERLNKQFKKEFTMSEEDVPKGVGLDVGTSFLVAGRFETDGKIHFNKMRDCFIQLEPKTAINAKFIKKGLDERKAPYIEKNGSFYVLGEDAFIMANERHIVTRRPMHRGVLSPAEKEAFPILQELIKRLVGKPRIKGEQLIFSSPAKPIDAEFDQLFHQDMIRSFINGLGYDAHPMNEAEALAYSELLEEGLTGIAISCLVPGTKIYANYGIKNIEDVRVGDTVITHRGRPQKVLNVINKPFIGKKTKIQIQGYSNSTEDYQFVDNHELYVNRNGQWEWIGCEEVKEGDLVGEPIVYQNPDLGKHTLTLCEKITSSPDTVKTQYKTTQNVFRLMGYFLGDGSANILEGCIQFDFHKNEKDNIEDVQEILRRSFGKQSSLIDKGENVIRIKCYSKGLASWFKNHCYDENKEKICPWSLERMSNGDCLNLLIGLIRSDGEIKAEQIRFGSISTNLVWLVKQLLARLGIAGSMQWREPREGGIVESRQIKGKKVEWSIQASGRLLHDSLVMLVRHLDCDNNRLAEKLFVRDGFVCGRIQKIDYEEYCGTVYDLQVEEDHSFSGPMLTIHNCGAGMMNVAVLSAGDPVVTFSTSRSGDWVDQQAATATNMTPSIIQQEKEDPDLDLMNPDPGNQVQAAIAVYYGNLLVYTLENIAHDLANSPQLPKFKDPIPLVVAGGTSLPKGFIAKFEQALNAVEMPVEISEIRHAADALHAVSNGLTLAASME